MIGKSELDHASDLHVHKFCSLLIRINLPDEKLLDLCTDQPSRDVGVCNCLQISVLLYLLWVNFLFIGMFH